MARDSHSHRRVSPLTFTSQRRVLVAILSTWPKRVCNLHTTPARNTGTLAAQPEIGSGYVVIGLDTHKDIHVAAIFAGIMATF